MMIANTTRPGAAEALVGHFGNGLQLSAPPRLEAPPAVLRWVFYAFVFSMPLFQSINVGIEDATLPKLVGYLLLLVTLLHPHIGFRQVPQAFWYFAAYLGVYALIGAFQEEVFQAEFLERLISLIQLLGLLVIAYNLMKFQRVAAAALVALVASCVTLAVLQLSGLGTTTYGAGAERLSALGQNANFLAGILSIGLLTLLYLAYGRDPGLVRPRFLTWPLLALLGIGVILTGSRGGLVGLGAGLVIFALRGRSIQARMRTSFLFLLPAAIVVGAFVFSEAARQRWEQSLEASNLAKREHLYPAAWEMFLEEPLVGWGPVRHTYELGWRTRSVGWEFDVPYRDTHNLILFVLTQVGLLGSVPFLIGMFLCLKAAWTGRTKTQGLLPLALIVALCFMNLSGTWIYYKLHWFILAYALAAEDAK
jgi:O-antigen ligase